MEKTVLGKTGIEVSRLCIGCWQAAGWATSDDDRFVKTVRHALDLGLNFLDTAVAYGAGHSETLVGKAIAGRRDEVVVASKLRASKSAPEDVRKELEGSLKRLNTDYIDIYQQHWPAKDVPLAETIGTLEELRDEGKLRVVGVSNWMEPEWEEIDDPSRIDTLQPNYSLLWRSIEKHVLELCKKHRIAVIPYSSLCQGILAGKFDRPDDAPDDSRRANRRLKPDQFGEVKKILAVLKEVADAYGKSMAETALRWLLDQDGVTAPIVGASRPDQVDRNLGALDWHLGAEDWQRLSDVSKPLSADLKPHDSMWGWHPRES